jgi:hypothetical protein
MARDEEKKVGLRRDILPRAVPFPPRSPVAMETFPWAATRGATRSARATTLLADGKSMVAVMRIGHGGN